MLRQSSSHQAQTGIKNTGLTYGISNVYLNSSLAQIHNGNIKRRIRRSTFALLTIVVILAGTACAIPGQATSKPAVTQTCNISMRWPDAEDTSSQGTPAANDQPVASFSQKISSGPNAQATSCNVVETQAKGSHFLADLDAALHMTPPQLKVLDIHTYNSRARKDYPEVSYINSGSEVGGRALFNRGILVAASLVNVTIKVSGKLDQNLARVIIATSYEVNGRPFVALASFLPSDNLSIGIPFYAVYCEPPFDFCTSTGDLEFGLGIPLPAILEGFNQQQFDPNHLRTPAFHHGNVTEITLLPGSVVDTIYQTSTDHNPVPMQSFLSSVSGSNPNVDVATAYYAAMQQFSDTMPPVFFPGASNTSIASAAFTLVQSPFDPMPYMHIVNLTGVTTTYEAGHTIYDYLFPHDRPTTTITINGVKTTAIPDFV